MPISNGAKATSIIDPWTRKAAQQSGVHLIVNLFEMLGDIGRFAAEFKSNNKPYNFYRYGNSVRK